MFRFTGRYFIYVDQYTSILSSLNLAEESDVWVGWVSSLHDLDSEGWISKEVGFSRVLLRDNETKDYGKARGIITWRTVQLTLMATDWYDLLLSWGCDSAPLLWPCPHGLKEVRWCGPGFCGYCSWNSCTNSDAWFNSSAPSHKNSSSVPS